MRVIHLAYTPVAGSPWNIVAALNTHTEIAARLVILRPNAYGHRTFPNDLVWEKDRDACIEALTAADVVHLAPRGTIGPAAQPGTTGARLVVHVHGRVRHEGDYRPVPVVLPDADVAVATSRAVAQFVQARRVEVIYPGVPSMPRGGGLATPSSRQALLKKPFQIDTPGNKKFCITFAF